MKRLERYRAIRIARRKCIFIFLIFLIIIFVGIFMVDYSLNGLMNNENGIKLFAIKRIEDEYYNIEIFNKSFYFNTDHIKEDFHKLLEWLNNI